MARYYMDVRTKVGLLRDEIGTEFPDLASAVDAARGELFGASLDRAASLRQGFSIKIEVREGQEPAKVVIVLAGHAYNRQRMASA